MKESSQSHQYRKRILIVAETPCLLGVYWLRLELILASQLHL